MIEKLTLKTSPHPRPYKLQWLSENGELVVDRQVLICFSIGKYVDEILFDVCVRIEMKLKGKIFFILGAWSWEKYAL